MKGVAFSAVPKNSPDYMKQFRCGGNVGARSGLRKPHTITRE